MKIRAMQLKDMEEVVGMMRVFYDSPAVIHAAPDEILRQDVKDCVGDCPYIEGYIFEENDRILGYSMVAKSYSTEYGGISELHFSVSLMKNIRIRRYDSVSKWRKRMSGRLLSIRKQDIIRCRICR